MIGQAVDPLIQRRIGQAPLKVSHRNTVGTLNLSPDGRWLLWSKQHYSDLGGDTAHRLVEILDISTQQVAYRFKQCVQVM